MYMYCAFGVGMIFTLGGGGGCSFNLIFNSCAKLIITNRWQTLTGKAQSCITKQWSQLNCTFLVVGWLTCSESEVKPNLNGFLLIRSAPCKHLLTLMYTARTCLLMRKEDGTQACLVDFFKRTISSYLWIVSGVLSRTEYLDIIPNFSEHTILQVINNLRSSTRTFILARIVYFGRNKKILWGAIAPLAPMVPTPMLWILCVLCVLCVPAVLVRKWLPMTGFSNFLVISD